MTRAVEAALVQEHALLLGMHELAHVDLGTNLIVGPEPGDLGVDEVRAALMGKRHAMVPAGDEVRAAELLDLDRRHQAVGEGGAQTGQSDPA
jgi:hypothetical protein